MNYMLNINVCEISPLLLENVAFYMGNLQVIKDSRGREWICSRVSLGALIRNRMRILSWLLFLYVFFYDFHESMLRCFYEILWWGPRAEECFGLSKIILLRSIKHYVVEFWRMNIYLFSFKILWQEVWHSVYVEKLLFSLWNFYVGKTRCYRIHLALIPLVFGMRVYATND